MSYFINKVIKGKSFDEAIEHVTAELKKEGFGVLTEIDVKDIFKKKLNIDFKKYKILGACNPSFAYKSLQSEDKIGVLLPCNVVVEEHENGEVEVSAVDPILAMSIVENKTVKNVAEEVKQKLKHVIDNLN